MRSRPAGELGAWATEGRDFGVLPAPLLDPGHRPQRIVWCEEVDPVALHNSHVHYLNGTEAHLVKEGDRRGRLRYDLVSVHRGIRPDYGLHVGVAVRLVERAH